MARPLSTVPASRYRPEDRASLTLACLANQQGNGVLSSCGGSRPSIVPIHGAGGSIASSGTDSGSIAFASGSGGSASGSAGNSAGGSASGGSASGSSGGSSGSGLPSLANAGNPGTGGNAPTTPAPTNNSAPTSSPTSPSNDLNGLPPGALALASPRDGRTADRPAFDAPSPTSAPSVNQPRANDSNTSNAAPQIVCRQERVRNGGIAAGDIHLSSEALMRGRTGPSRSLSDDSGRAARSDQGNLDWRGQPIDGGTIEVCEPVAAVPTSTTSTGGSGSSSGGSSSGSTGGSTDPALKVCETVAGASVCTQYASQAELDRAARSKVLTTPVTFACNEPESNLISRGVASVRYGTTAIYVGYEDTGGLNQDPRVARFDNGQQTWCRTDYATTNDDSAGYGLIWNGKDKLYAVFTSAGDQGNANQDFRRFASRGWLTSYGNGKGPFVAVLASIDLATGNINNASFLSSLQTNGSSNSVRVTSLALLNQGLQVKSLADFFPRRVDRTAFSCTNGIGGFDYTTQFSADLTTVSQSSAPGCN